MVVLVFNTKATDPKVSTVTAISKALGCSVNHLMGEEIYTPKEVNLILNYRKPIKI